MSYLFVAYLIIWLVLFAYLLRISRKQAQLEKDIESVKKLLKEK